MGQRLKEKNQQRFNDYQPGTQQAIFHFPCVVPSTTAVDRSTPGSPRSDTESVQSRAEGEEVTPPGTEPEPVATSTPGRSSTNACCRMMKGFGKQFSATVGAVARFLSPSPYAGKDPQKTMPHEGAIHRD